MAKANAAPRTWSPHRQKRLDRFVQIVGWLLFAASFFSWFPSRVPIWFVIVLCLAPWLALAAVIFGKGRFLLLGPDGKTVFNIAFSVPMGLIVGALLNFDIVDWKWPIVVSTVGGAVYLGGCYVAVLSTATQATVARRMRRKSARDLFMVLSVSLIGAALVWATIVFVNALRDVRPAATMSGTVVSKSFSGGRGHSYYLHLSGQPTTLGIDAFRVSKSRYDHTRIGQVSCTVVHTGLLGLRFYDVIDC